MKIINYIISIFIVGLFLLPDITIAPGIPAVRLEDIMVHSMLLTLLIKGKNKIRLGSSLKNYIFALIMFILWISITMFGNGRITFKSDYFEYYKILKYMVIVTFFYIFTKNTNSLHKDPFQIIRYIFYFVVIFNLFHFFNILGFNSIVMPYYSPEWHLSSFGLYNLGEGDKRLLGTLGNPNNNGIILGFFCAFFLASFNKNKVSKLSNLFSLLVSIILLIMTQSRTIFIAFFAMYLGYWLLSGGSKRHLIYLVVISYSVLLFINLFGFKYTSLLWTKDLVENTSWTTRLEIWDFLFEMIKKSPWIGYGPNKDFFYQNNLYSENEYIVMTWRYGYIGLVYYLLWILIPVYTAIKSKRLVSSKIIILFSIIILISALANNPLSEPRIMALYATLCGIMYADFDQKTIYGDDK